MYSVVPLSPKALIAVVCQDPNTDVVDAVDVDINDVLDACQNLVIVDSQLDICRFSHLSVQEYLEKHWKSHDANVMELPRTLPRFLIGLVFNRLSCRETCPAC